MALADLTDQTAVLEAMKESDRLGEDAFLAKYGFNRSRKYRIEHEGRTYTSKALLAAAHGVQFPSAGPLSNTELSGGRETNTKARALGFDVQTIGQGDDALGTALGDFMAMYDAARLGAFSGSHPAFAAIKHCAALIEEALPESLRGAKVKPSVGQGNWATVPWIAVLHPDETTSTQQGVYPVLLFHEDTKSVEVTIAQGVTELTRTRGRREAVKELSRTSTALREHLEGRLSEGFRLDDDLDLGTSSLARSYVASTVAHRRYERDALPQSDVLEDVAGLLEVYGDLLTAGTLSELDAQAPAAPVRHALMVYVGQAADPNFEYGGRQGWWGWKEAPSGLEEMRPGDLIAFGRGFEGGSPRVDAAVWQLSAVRELVVGRVVEPPKRTDEFRMADELTGDSVYPWKVRFEPLGDETSVSLAPGARLSGEAGEALRRSVTRGLAVLAPIAGSPLLEEYMNHEGPDVAPIPSTIGGAAERFVEAVIESGLRLPPADIAAFLAAIVAKPFVILTGQSGSGKTQLAKRLGEWFGSSAEGRPRYHVVPVRPDWTGPEYLFGYPDALRSRAGTEVWAVPDTLEFLLRAAAEPTAPYLLVLDEMNLAHVERYFADFLSGVESREPVLPELRREDGEWVATGNSQRLPLPRNLFVVGTVNVDETTYMFSPKVLDRAFTFEFRTATAELDAGLRRPASISAAGHADLNAVVVVTLDDNWQHEHPHTELNDLVEDLRIVHEMLSPSGHDFGHRVMYEALRYAALLQAAGAEDRFDVLDRVLLTKVLPKLHGTRARIEQPLRALRDFAHGDSEAEASVMPRTVRKLDRMIAVVVEAQFVSFTE